MPLATNERQNMSSETQSELNNAPADDSWCEKHNRRKEQTQFGPICRACFNEATNKTKANGGIRERAPTGLRCATCGQRVKPPAIMVNGIGPCCRLKEYPRPQSIPDVSDVTDSDILSEVAEVAGIDIRPPIQNIDVTDVAALSGYVNSILSDLGPIPEEINQLPDGGIELREGRGDIRKYETADLPDVKPATALPEPIRKIDSVIIHLRNENAKIVSEAIEAMHIEFDQQNADDATLLALICKEWMKGNGRIGATTAARPAPDF